MPRKFDYALALEPYAYDPKKAKELLKELAMRMASMLASQRRYVYFGWMMEAIANDLTAVGIRVKVPPHGTGCGLCGASGEDVQKPGVPWQWGLRERGDTPWAFVYSKGAESWIKDPEIDAWYEQQAVERDRKKRQDLLYKIQQKLYDEARFMTIWELASCVPQGHEQQYQG